MPSSKPARQPSRREPGTGCRRTPRTAMSSASSKARTSSRRDTRRSASRQSEPRRRNRVAGSLCAEGVDRHRRGKDRRAREESGKLRRSLHFQTQGSPPPNTLPPDESTTPPVSSVSETGSGDQACCHVYNPLGIRYFRTFHAEGDIAQAIFGVGHSGAMDSDENLGLQRNNFGIQLMAPKFCCTQVRARGVTI